jgi:hypothetical protein
MPARKPAWQAGGSLHKLRYQQAHFGEVAEVDLDGARSGLFGFVQKGRQFPRERRQIARAVEERDEAPGDLPEAQW